MITKMLLSFVLGYFATPIFNGLVATVRYVIGLFHK